jgi:hypothetical protein
MREAVNETTGMSAIDTFINIVQEFKVVCVNVFIIPRGTDITWSINGIVLEIRGYTYLRIHYRPHLSACCVQTARYIKVILHMVSTNIHSCPMRPTLNKSVMISQRYNKNKVPNPLPTRLPTDYAVYICILALRWV